MLALQWKPMVLMAVAAQPRSPLEGGGADWQSSMKESSQDDGCPSSLLPCWGPLPVSGEGWDHMKSSPLYQSEARGGTMVKCLRQWLCMVQVDCEKNLCLSPI